jgi:hypothetical protein
MKGDESCAMLGDDDVSWPLVLGLVWTYLGATAFLGMGRTEAPLPTCMMLGWTIFEAFNM